jgi:hypothetical protein
MMPDWSYHLWNALAAAAVLLLPGFALLAWLPKPGPTALHRIDPLSAIADAVALSFALSALLALAQFVSGVQIPPLGVVGLYGLCVFALISAVVWRGIGWPGRRQWITALVWAFAAGLLIFALVAWRLYQAHSLDLPAWVDPVHHTLIVRVIFENGGIPPDYLPYIPAPFYYHYGFHLMAALFAFWSQLPAHDAVLWFGQVINAVVALSVYRAACAFSVDPTRAEQEPGQGYRPRAVATGIAAALLTGFVFQMPAYYLTWGRYTLLSGLILLGPALAAVWEAWREPARRDAWPRIALLLAAMSLTHYFAVILIGLFLAPLGVWGVVQAIRSAERRAALLRMVLWCGAGILLVLPWLWRVILANTQSVGVQVVPLEQSDSAWTGAVDYLRYIIYLIGPRHNHILMGIAGVGLIAAFLRPQMRLFTIWSVLLALLSLPWGLRFNLVRPDYFAIILFFPAAVLVANLLVSSAEGAASLFRDGPPWPARVQYAVLAVALGLIIAWGIRETHSVINPVTVLATRADVDALEWVKRSTPPDARFFINSTYWMQGLDRGVDGGYWLLPYTGRASLLPPVLYMWGDEAYQQQLQDHIARSRQIQGCNPEFWNLVRDANLTHIYLREGVGHLQPAMLQDCPRLKLQYQQDGVFIYEINRP